MNPVIEQHFDEVEVRLLQSLAIATYQIMTREIAFSDGKLRIKLVPRDGGNDRIVRICVGVSRGNSVAEIELSLARWSGAVEKALGQCTSLSKSAKCATPCSQ